MKKKSLGLLLAAALSFGAISPAQAQEVNAPVASETSVTAEQDTATNSQSSEPNTGVIVGSVVGALALAGLIAGGVYWAVQQRMIPNPLPGIIPNPPAPAPAPAPGPAPAPAPAPRPAPAPPRVMAPAPARVTASYANCTAVWNSIGRPIRSGDPGFMSKFDRDGDGVGCERDPR